MTPSATGPSETGTPLPGKLAIVVDESLPPGLAANAASVLALTLGHRVEGLIGPDAKDGDGRIHPGITTMPLPILTASAGTLGDIVARASSDEGVLLVDFTDCAQRTRTYADYTELLEATTAEDLSYVAVALCGSRKKVEKLTGSLGLLR